ncbi:MAG TPA: 3-hydroxyacyl-CoA dehydrogenase family protein [Spirochaetia bacterium]|nr:3-hydroxyacyl-CoA dehydrogenase family protein [Spirochaetia bacterium]
MMGEIKRVACIGSGTIGSSWATNFIVQGYPVNLYDVNEKQLAVAGEAIRRNLRFLAAGNIIKEEQIEHSLSLVHYTTDIGDAVGDVQFIQENGPESYEVKQGILAQIDEHAGPGAIYASSSSGLLISMIAKYAKRPERCIGGHPYNPPHLVPLVEITKGEQTAAETVSASVNFYKSLGKEPIVLNKEVPGFIANRLQMAVNREVVDLVTRGVCSVEDADKAINFGPGLRWAIFGPNLLYHLGGGPGGIKGLMSMLAPSAGPVLADLAAWKEMPADWPDLAEKGVLQELANLPAHIGTTTEDACRFRDRVLVELLKLHHKYPAGT